MSGIMITIIQHVHCGSKRMGSETFWWTPML